MIFRKLQAIINGKKFTIEEDLPGVGFYLIVYDGEKSTHDFLQDTIEICKEMAYEDFGVPFYSWEDITE